MVCVCCVLLSQMTHLNILAEAAAYVIPDLPAPLSMCENNLFPRPALVSDDVIKEEHLRLDFSENASRLHFKRALLYLIS